MAKFFLRTKNTTGQGTLYTRIQKSGLNMLLSTGLSVDIEKWNQAQESASSWIKYTKTVPGSLVAAKMNEISNTLAAMIAQGNTDKEDLSLAMEYIVNREAHKKMEEQIAKDMEEREKRRRALESDPLTYLGRAIAKMENHTMRYHGKIYSDNTIHTWKVLYKQLELFMQSCPFTFDDMCQQVADEFLSYCEDCDFAVSTTKQLASQLNILCNRAKSEGITDNRNIGNISFAKYRGEGVDASALVYLDSYELDALYKMPLVGTRCDVRDLFLIGCYTCQRVSDYSKITRDNFGTTAAGTKVVRLRQEKTGGYVTVPILDDRLFKILDRHDFELIHYSNTNFNRIIKEILRDLSETVPSLAEKYKTIITIAEKAQEKRKTVTFERDKDGNVVKPKWQLVSSHTARRSGITNLYLTGKFDALQMMSISGHKKIETFLKYIRVTQDQVADQIAKQYKGYETIIKRTEMF